MQEIQEIKQEEIQRSQSVYRYELPHARTVAFDSVSRVSDIKQTKPSHEFESCPSVMYVLDTHALARHSQH